MVKVVMHLMSLIVFLLLGVLLGAENVDVLSKNQNELASGDVNEQPFQSDPKTLTNKSPSEEFSKNGPEVALLDAIAAKDNTPDKSGANEIDPKLTKVVAKLSGNLNYVKSENPEVPENATESFVPVEIESLLILGPDHFVNKVTIPQVQTVQSVNSKVMEMEDDVTTKISVGTLDSDHFTTGKHSTSKSEVTNKQHSTTKSEIEETKTIISKSRTTKASSEAITVKIPTEGKGKSGYFKPPKVETSKGKPPKENCQQNHEKGYFESSQSNSAFRNINSSLAYFILNLVMMVMLI